MYLYTDDAYIDLAFFLDLLQILIKNGCFSGVENDLCRKYE